MAYTDEQLSLIFDRTDGRCHLCGLKLCFGNYGRFGRRGAREVEHSNSRSNGEAAVCVTCTLRIPSAIAKRGRRLPGPRVHGTVVQRHLSRQKKDEIRNDNRWGWGSIGALTGGAILGPAGLLLGGILGAIVGDGLNSE